MLYIFWEFQVRPDQIAEFERRYASDGDWANLFRTSPHFKSTTLGRDVKLSGHYLVTDVWDSAASFAEFKQQFREAYSVLDKQCESLTLSEKHLGDFEIL